MNQAFVNSWIDSIVNKKPAPRLTDEETLAVLTELFDDYLLPSGIVAVRFRGYTPYFNDGDPCHHYGYYCALQNGRVLFGEDDSDEYDVEDIIPNVGELQDHPAILARQAEFLLNNTALASELAEEDFLQLAAVMEANKYKTNFRLTDSEASRFSESFKQSFLKRIHSTYYSSYDLGPELKARIQGQPYTEKVDAVLNNLDDLWCHLYDTNFEVQVYHDPLTGVHYSQEFYNPEA